MNIDRMNVMRMNLIWPVSRSGFFCPWIPYETEGTQPERPTEGFRSFRDSQWKLLGGELS